MKELCVLLEASGTPISVAERKVVLLEGLPSEFDVVVSSASLSLTPLPLQRLVDAFVECENHQARTVQEIVFAANLVEGSSS